MFLSRVERRPKWWWFLPVAAARIRIWVSTCWQSRSRSAKKMVMAFYGAAHFFLDFGCRKLGSQKIPAFLLSDLTVFFQHCPYSWPVDRPRGTRNPWARRWGKGGMGRWDGYETISVSKPTVTELINLSSRKLQAKKKLGKSAQTLINYQGDLMNFTFWYRMLTSCWLVRLHVPQLAIAEAAGDGERESDSPSEMLEL